MACMNLWLTFIMTFMFKLTKLDIILSHSWIILFGLYFTLNLNINWFYIRRVDIKKIFFWKNWAYGSFGIQGLEDFCKCLSVLLNDTTNVPAYEWHLSALLVLALNVDAGVKHAYDKHGIIHNHTTVHSLCIRHANTSNFVAVVSSCPVLIY